MTTILELLLTHDGLTGALVRLPGTPPSSCRHPLVRVRADGERDPFDEPPVLDEAQAGEGEIGRHVEALLFRCDRCRNTLVVVRCPDGTWRLRNQHGPAAAEGA